MLRIKCEIYSRPCGYFRPVNQWNNGKKQEFKDRKYYKLPEGLNNETNNNKRKDTKNDKK